MMKKYLIYIVCLPILIWLCQACEERNYIDGVPSPYIALQDVRALYKNSDVVMSSDLLSDASMITGVVISDHNAGNVPEGIVVMQQYKRNELFGIALRVGTAAGDFQPGDSIVVQVQGKELKKDGYLYIDGLNASDIQKAGKMDHLNLRNVTGATLYVRIEEFESTLVKIVGGAINPRPSEGETFAGTKNLVSGADTLVTRTLPSASFANLELPRNLNIIGVVLRESGESSRIGVWARRAEDIEDVSDPEIPGDLGDNPIIITGYLADPTGGDSNYEYIQLLANADLNFAEIPFSVVVCNNANSAAPNAGAPPGAGWATGGGRTFKFNLTEGQVQKGEFFYVGGHQRRINGANSTSIADANWARYIQYAQNSFDGIGDATTNLLANSGNAAGIALFVGTNINATSVPIDVVFYGGTGEATIIDSINNIGYRVANNDHYNPFDQETGGAQPFFSMGTNRYRIPHSTPSNAGIFVRLGGVFNTTTRKWEVPRAHFFHTLAVSSAITELESGEGVTEQVE